MLVAEGNVLEVDGGVEFQTNFQSTVLLFYTSTSFMLGISNLGYNKEKNIYVQLMTKILIKKVIKKLF